MFKSIDINPIDRIDREQQDYEKFVSLYHYFLVCFMAYKTFKNPNRVSSYHGCRSFIQFPFYKHNNNSFESHVVMFLLVH